MSQLWVNWAFAGYSYQNWMIVKIILNDAWWLHIDFIWRVIHHSTSSYYISVL